MENSWFYDFLNGKNTDVFKSRQHNRLEIEQRKYFAEMTHFIDSLGHLFIVSVSEKKSGSTMATACPNINIEVYNPFSAFSGCCCY